MPDASSKMKRPAMSAFGEGTVVQKRQRKEPQSKPKSSDGRPPTASAILSGPDNGFRVKPVSSPAGGQRPPARPQGLPANQKEALTSFKPTTSTKTPVRTKPTFMARPPVFPLLDEDSPFVDPQKKTGFVRARLESPLGRAEKLNSVTTPLSSRIRHLDPRATTPKLTTPARKIVPFLALPVPVEIPEESPAESSTTPLKPLPLPRFDIGGKVKAKLTAMKVLEPPAMALPEEKEVEGEALELQRGLNVSPQKNDRRRSRFIRNGLAEHAQLVINRSSTALILWKKEIESSASRPGRLQADLRLHVKDVIHVSRNSNVQSRSAGTVRSILAVCALPDAEERTVLFSLSPDVDDSVFPGTGKSIAEGSEVLVWKPWQENKHPPTMFCSRFVVLPTLS